MKKVQILSAISFMVFLSFLACNQPAEPKGIENAEEKLAQVEMKVEGMVCAMGCAKLIEDKVAKMDGIKESKVDFENEVAYFSFDENVLNAEELEKFIDEIHDGQYNATIIAKAAEEEKNVEPQEKSQESIDQGDVEEEELEKKKVSVVVNKIQNISFPELLTYFMKRL